MTKEKLLYPNTTQVPNLILDTIMWEIPPTAVRVLLVIVRHTLGWVEDPITGRRKERDWISVSQFEKFTGKKDRSISSALTLLVNELGLVEAFDEKGDKLMTAADRKHKKVFYRLNLTRLHTQKIADVENSKVQKIADGAYAYKVQKIADNKSIQNNNNINIGKALEENSSKKQEISKEETKTSTGMKSLREALTQKGILKENTEPTKGIHTPWQEKAFRYADKLGIKLEGRDTARWLKIFKQAEEGRKSANIERAYSYLVDHQGFQFKDNEAKLKNFFYIYENGVGNHSASTSSASTSSP